MVFLFIIITVTSAQQGNVNGKYFSMTLPYAWNETDGHIFLDQITTETGIRQSNIDSTFKCFVDSQNYYNMFLVSERIYSRKNINSVTLEQLAKKEGIKKEYNSREFLITTDPFDGSLIAVSVHTIFEDAIYYVVFILDNDNLDLVDQVLSTINFEYVIPEVNKEGFLIGLWHGVRTPFVFVINLFKSDKYVVFSENGNIGYKIGYMIAVLFILSTIFGGTRRRYKRPEKEE